MASIRFEPDPRGVAHMLRSPEMQSAMLDVASKAKSFAESISPYDDGDYKAAFDVEPAEFATSRGGTRKGATLTNNARHAAAVEWKHDHHVLGQTLARFDDRGKR